MQARARSARAESRVAVGADRDERGQYRALVLGLTMVKGRKMTEAEDVTALTISYADLRDYTASLFAAAGAPEADAKLMGECLAGNDLHGSSGHGTACAADPDTGGWQGYVNRMLPGPDQSVNPAPNVQMVEHSGTTAVFDGDGGMGHIACKKAVDWAIGAAKEHGTACVTTRNHFHFGGESLSFH